MISEKKTKCNSQSKNVTVIPKIVYFPNSFQSLSLRNTQNLGNLEPMNELPGTPQDCTGVDGAEAQVAV